MTAAAVAGRRRLAMAGIERARRCWDALFDEPAGLRPMALLRIAVGPIVLLHLLPFLTDVAGGGWYGDRFTQPYAAWYPQAPRPLYAALLVAGAVAAVLLSLGAWTRVTAAVTFAVVTYNLFLSRTHFHNNRAFLVILLAGVWLAPSGRVLSVDARRRRRRTGQPPADLGPHWPQALVRFEASAVDLASGTSKLVDPDWWSGLVTWDRVVRVRPRLDATVLPEPVVDLLATRGFHTGAAKVIVFTELFIGLGLWHRRTRLAAVWVAVAFHLAIEVSASVQVFTVAAIAALVVWADPSAGRRRVVVRGDSAGARGVAFALRRLDWLGRFELERGPDAGDGGPAVALHDGDGDGVERHGAAAARVVLARLPLLFWPVAPAALPGLRAAWDRALAPVFGPRAGPTDPPTPPGATTRRARAAGERTTMPAGGAGGPTRLPS